MKYQFADQMKWPKEYASAKCWQMSSSFTNNTKLYYTLESVYPESTKVNAHSKFDPFWPLSALILHLLFVRSLTWWFYSNLNTYLIDDIFEINNFLLLYIINTRYICLCHSSFVLVLSCSVQFEKRNSTVDSFFKIEWNKSQ